MSRVFKTRPFIRWMRKTELTDAALRKAVAEMEQGLIDADLGGGIVKKRVPLPGRGKSGSTRTLIATNKRDRWFFLYGFEKNQRENVTAEELQAWRTVSPDWLRLSLKELDYLVATGTLEEIGYGD
jgi:hypothetical protein